MPSCASTIGMFSRCASSSMRASTRSRFGKSPSMYSCSSSVTSTVLIATPQELLEQRLEHDDVQSHALHSVAENSVVKPRGGKRLVKPRPTPVPWLELGVRQARLDLHHARTEIGKRGLVLVSRGFEVEPDLDATRASVVPGLEVERGLPEVNLHEPPAPARAAERPQPGWQAGFQALPQPAEEVRWREQHLSVDEVGM